MRLNVAGEGTSEKTVLRKNVLSVKTQGFSTPLGNLAVPPLAILRAAALAWC